MIPLNIEELKVTASYTYGSGIKNAQTICKARRKLKAIEKGGFKCCVCGTEENLTIDHIKPCRELECSRYSKKALKGNTQLLCISCHLEKNRVERELWRQQNDTDRKEVFEQ